MTEPNPAPPKLEQGNEKTQSFSADLWPTVLDDIKANHNTLYGILRMASPNYDNDKLILSFKFAFHQKRINEPKMHQLITDTFVRLNIIPVRIEAIVDTNQPTPTPIKQPLVDIAAISNIFGDAEVLES